jgi:hypothetical protein
MAQASDVFTDVKLWLKSRGVHNFEPVSLFADQLTKAKDFCGTFIKDLTKLGSKGH